VKDAKKPIVAVLALVAAAALTACGSGDDSTTAADGGESATVTGQFAPVSDEAKYSKVSGEAKLERSSGGTTVSIVVSGLEPKTAYIGHLHVSSCGQSDPGGPHFQFEPGGSDEPPNEMHLQFTSDAAGDGEATTSSKREVPPGEAGSVVIHVDDHHEMTGAEAGESESLFVHEGVDHSKEGGHGEDRSGHQGGSQHSSGKVACAELEGALAEEGDSTAGGDVPTIVVRNGEPVGGVQNVEFRAGEEVRFRVSSDEAEEIHVHGYDLAKNVPAGGMIEFAFPADLEGIYEVELEGQAVQILELQINP